MMYIVTRQKIVPTCSSPESLPEIETKCGGLINLAEKISRQSNVKAGTMLPLSLLTRFTFIENQEQSAQWNDAKGFKFG